MKKIGFVFICCTGLLSNCTLLAPEPEIPSYLYIDEFSFSCNLDTQGYPSENISDGWVYVNNELIGVFELPAFIPILDTGNADIIVYPGIKENGSSATRKIYPFYTAYTTSSHIEAAQTDTLHPSSTYVSTGIGFIVHDRCETSNPFSPSANSDTVLVQVTGDEVFEGLRSFREVLEGNNYFFRCGTPPLVIPGDGRNVYLELDYKCDTQFEIWLNGTKSGSEFPEYIITVSPKEFWNKIYVNLSNAARLIQADTYSLELRQSRPTSADSASLYIDNVKIIAAD